MKYLFVLLFLLSAQASYGQMIGSAVPTGRNVTTSQNVVLIPCGANVNSYAASAAQGGTHGYGPATVFQLSGSAASPCTYQNQTFHTQSNEVIQGDCSSSVGANTILDGGNGAANGPNTQMTNGDSDGATGVTLQCVTVQNYAGSHTCPNSSAAGCNWQGDNGTSEDRNAEVVTWDGWLLTKDTFTSSGGWGVTLQGSATASNSRFVGNYHGGINPEACLPGSNDQAAFVQGSEIANNNLRGDYTYTDAAGFKATSSGNPDCSPLYFLNNWVHDNANTIGVWLDGFACNKCVVQGNTILDNGQSFQCEITGGTIAFNNDISHNVIQQQANGAGWVIKIDQCAQFNIHDNNILYPSAGIYGGLGVLAENRNGNQEVANNLAIYNNTITFTSTGGNENTGVGQFPNCTSLLCSNPATWSVHNNSYHSTAYSNSATAAANGTYFMFILQNGYSLNSAQAGSPGWEIGSTMTIGNASVSGCQRIGCAGSGW
jgi:hypothetical protein